MQELFTEISNAFDDISILKEASRCCNNINSTEIITKTNIDNIEFFTSNGEVKIESLKAWKYKQSIQ